jgi:hypothetical protein
MNGVQTGGGHKKQGAREGQNLCRPCDLHCSRTRCRGGSRCRHAICADWIRWIAIYRRALQDQALHSWGSRWVSITPTAANGPPPETDSIGGDPGQRSVEDIAVATKGAWRDAADP